MTHPLSSNLVIIPWFSPHIGGDDGAGHLFSGGCDVAGGCVSGGGDSTAGVVVSLFVSVDAVPGGGVDSEVGAGAGVGSGAGAGAAVWAGSGAGAG